MKAGFGLAAAVTLAGMTFMPIPVAAMGNLADIRIFDRAENRELPVYWHQGKAYIAGRPGNEYQISVRNRSGADVLAVVAVDGVNAISGETANPGQTGYVLGNGVAYDIRGWRKSNSRTAAFYFTELPDSYAARTGRPDNVGVIGVAVFRRKPVTPPMAIGGSAERRQTGPSASAEAAHDGTRELARDAAPDSVPSAAGENRLSSPAAPAASMAQSDSKAQSQPARERSLGTGHGRSETSVVRNVAFERATPYPEEVIALHYDSYQNLVARGVVAPVPVVRPQPQPFPGRFVPDPPRG